MARVSRPEGRSRRPDCLVRLDGAIAAGGPETNKPSKETASFLSTTQKRLADTTIQKASLLHHLHLGAQFTQRTPRDVKEPQGVLIRPAAGAFGDVRWHGDRRPAQLIDEREVIPDRRDIHDSIDFDREGLGGLPCRKIAITDHLGIFLGMHRVPIIEKPAPTALPAITYQPPEAPTPSPNPATSPSRASMLSQPPSAIR
jgi:hypothetical protein